MARYSSVSSPGATRCSRSALPGAGFCCSQPLLSDVSLYWTPYVSSVRCWSLLLVCVGCSLWSSLGLTAPLVFIALSFEPNTVYTIQDNPEHNYRTFLAHTHAINHKQIYRTTRRTLHFNRTCAAVQGCQ